MRLPFSLALLIVLLVLSNRIASRPAIANEHPQRSRTAEGCVNQACRAAHRLLDSPDDATAIWCTLALLHGAVQEGDRRFGNIDDLVERLARRTSKFEGITRERLVGLLKLEGEQNDVELFNPIRRFEDFYNKLFDIAPWPLEWKARKAFWLDVAVSVMNCKTVMDPAAAWRERIAGDAMHAGIYRLCYLGVARSGAVKADQFDFAIIEAELEQRLGHTTADLIWQTRLLETYVAAGFPADHPRRSGLRKRLLENLQAVRADWSTIHSEVRHVVVALENLHAVGAEWSVVDPEIRDVFVALAQLHRRPGSENESLALFDALLDFPNRHVFDEFARQAGLTAQEREQRFRKKNVIVIAANKPLCSVVQELSLQVVLRLWIDDTVSRDTTPVNLKFEGTWSDAMEMLLSRSKYELMELDYGIWWIGPPMAKDHALGLLKRSRDKIPADANLARVLNEETVIDLVDVPLLDAADYLADFHRTPIAMLGDAGHVRVSLLLREVPLHVGLSLLTNAANVDWYVSNATILIGPVKDLDAFRKLDARRAKQLAEVRKSRPQAADKLVEITKGDFIHHPLADVCHYLDDLHSCRDATHVVSILVDARRNDGHRPLSCRLERPPLNWALDFLLYPLDLTWATDGYVIFVSNMDGVQHFSHVAATRENRRQQYPQQLSEKLQKLVTFEFVNTRFSDVADSLSEMTGLSISVADGIKGDAISAQLQEIPCDVAFDTLAIANGLEWRIVNRTVEFSRSKN